MRITAVQATVVTALVAACGGPAPETAGASGEAISTGGLPELGLDPSETTVSGLSSGAFMAVQMHVASSATVHGAAVFAGGPYLCSSGELGAATTTCMDPSSSAGVPSLASAQDARVAAALGLIDPVSNLRSSRVFLFGGADDVVVHPAVMAATARFYGALVDPAGIEAMLAVPGTGHVFPTIARGGPCASPDSTYIGACGLDGAGLALAQLYGPLHPASTTPGGTLERFSQRPYGPGGSGLAADGYVYVPAACEGGQTCRLHVVFHGCKQYATGPVGVRFMTETGFLERADTNRLVILFPQISPSDVNPNGCWDFWGYSDEAFATKAGPQVAAVREMISRLTATP